MKFHRFVLAGLALFGFLYYCSTSGSGGGSPSDPCAGSPSISSVTIANINSTTADVGVTVSASSTLGAIDLGFYNAVGTKLNSSPTTGTGTSGTFALTVNHTLGPGGPLYPYAKVCDTASNCTTMYLNPSKSTSMFTENCTTNGLIDVVSSLALSSGNVVSPGTDGGILPVPTGIGTYTNGDLGTAIGNIIHYQFSCSSGGVYYVQWLDDGTTCPIAPGTYSGDPTVSIYDSLGGAGIVTPIAACKVSLNNAAYTGTCTIVVSPNVAGTFGIQVYK